MKESNKELNKYDIDYIIKKMKIAIIFIGISICTYIFPFSLGMFDFGIVVEITSGLILLIAILQISKYNIKNTKILVLISVSIIVLLMIYDIINILLGNDLYKDIFHQIYIFFKMDTFIVIYVYVLIIIIKRLKNINKHRKNKDIFYE